MNEGGTVASGYTSGTTYNPGNTGSHTYYVQAVLGSCTTLSAGSAFADANNTPVCTTLISPLNGATDVLLSAKLNWNSASGADNYDVYLGTVNPPAWVANTTGTSYDPGGMVSGSWYYWKIVPKNDCGSASNCPVWSFQTCFLPNAAAGPIPYNGAMGVPLSQTLNWDPEAASFFDVYFGISTNPPFVGTVTLPTFDPGPLLANTMYHWKIVPGNLCGIVLNPVIWTFTTTGGTPPPEVAPGNTQANAINWPDNQTISWPSIPEATEYQLYRGIMTDLPKLLTSDVDSCIKYIGPTASATDTSNPLVDGVPDNLYWYLVTASNGAGEGPAGNATAGPRIVNSTGSCPP